MAGALHSNVCGVSLGSSALLLIVQNFTFRPWPLIANKKIYCSCLKPLDRCRVYGPQLILALVTPVSLGQATTRARWHARLRYCLSNLDNWRRSGRTISHVRISCTGGMRDRYSSNRFSDSCSSLSRSSISFLLEMRSAGVESLQMLGPKT